MNLKWVYDLDAKAVGVQAYNPPRCQFPPLTGHLTIPIAPLQWQANRVLAQR